MLENYSVGARRVVALATTEARLLDHPRVGTEHLLLGLLSDDEGDAVDVLHAAGARLSAARHKVVEAVGADAGSAIDGMPFTARAQRALERAGRFARKDREPEVTAAHVLLGVLDVEGLACQVLRGLGVDVIALRGAVVAGRPEEAVAPVEDPPEVEALRPQCPRCRAQLDESLTESQVPARREDDLVTVVSVLYCAACGTTLGFLRPERSPAPRASATGG